MRAETETDKTVSIKLNNADVKDAVRLIAKLSGKNVIVPNTIEGTVTIGFDHVTPEDALKSILDTYGLISIDDGNVMKVATVKDFQEKNIDLQSKTIQLKYAKSVDMIPQLQPLLSARGKVTYDERTNGITVSGNTHDVEIAEMMVQRTDIQDRQVLIEAKIVEASFSFLNSLGVQWGFLRSGSSVTVDGVSSVGTVTAGGSTANLNVNTPARGSSGISSGIGLIMGIMGTQTTLNLTAAEEKGDISILSRPSITTLNNQPASIRSGSTFYVKTSSGLTIGGSGGTSSSSTSGLQAITSGIELKVTPQISSDDMVKLMIQATESQPDFTKAVDNIPAIIDNTASTIVLLKNGETTVIGGLLQTKKSQSRAGVPFLSRIPIIGALFRSTNRSKDKTELIVFITPTILKDTLKEIPSIKADPESMHYSSKK